MIDRSIDQWSSDNRCLFKRTRDRLTNELRKLIWTKPVAINQFFLFLSFFTPPLSLYYFFFFFFLFPPLFFYKHRCFSLLPIPKDDFLISPRQLASSSFGSTSFSQVLIQRDLTLQKNHRRDPIDDFLFSLISPFFDLHFEKNRSQSISLPHIQLFLFNSSLQKLFSSQLPITSSLRSFRSISVPPQGTHYREAHRLLEDYAAYTIQRCMHEPRFTNNSTDPSKFWEGAPVSRPTQT